MGFKFLVYLLLTWVNVLRTMAICIYNMGTQDLLGPLTQADYGQDDAIATIYCVHDNF